MCVAAQTSFGEWDRVYPQRTIDEENGRAAAALTGTRRARAKAERWRNIVLGGRRGGGGGGESRRRGVGGEFDPGCRFGPGSNQAPEVSDLSHQLDVM